MPTKKKDVTPTLSDTIERLNESETPVEFKDNDFELAPAFDAFLSTAPAILDKAKTVLAQDIDKSDEKAIKQFNSEFKDVPKVKKVIKRSEDLIKEHFDKPKEEMLARFHQILSERGIDDIDDVQKQLTQRKKDFQAYRKEQRWDQLKDWFDGAIKNYPIIAEKTPHLADFETFKANHDKMVSGAVTGKVKEADFDKITNELASYNAIISQITTFQASQLLDEESANQLLSDFEHDPSQTDFNAKIADMVAQLQQKRQAEILEANQKEVQAQLSAKSETSDKVIIPDIEPNTIPADNDVIMDFNAEMLPDQDFIPDDVVAEDIPTNDFVSDYQASHGGVNTELLASIKAQIPSLNVQPAARDILNAIFVALQQGADSDENQLLATIMELLTL